MIKFLYKIKPFWKIASFLWHKIALCPWFRPILKWIISSQIKPYDQKPITKKKKGVVRILALNAPRYTADIETLLSHDDVEIYVLPHQIQTLINALFYRNLPDILDGLDNVEKFQNFHEQKNEVLKAERSALVQFLEKFLPELFKKSEIDAVMSCSFFYMADVDWQIACKNVGIPYFSLHKENMQDSVVYDQMVKRYSSMRLRFFGHRLFLYNHLVKKVILGAGICDEDMICVTGACRMDALFHKVKNNQINAPKDQVTLFSSHHCIGLLSVPDAMNYFSSNPDEGFVEYFDLVHGNMIKFAHENPNITVVIKPKWGGSWIEYIKAAGQKIAGLNADDIPNLIITIDTPAQELIENSKVVAGINSTTLLESLIVGRPVVVPLFAEAAGKYYDRHVYFKDYVDQAFNVVRNPDMLGAAILDEINGRVPPREIPEQMIKDYLGYFDEHSTRRVIEQMKKDITNITAEAKKKEV